MKDQINLTGISAIGYHGVFPEERKNGQNFVVDLKLNFELAEDAQTSTADPVADVIAWQEAEDSSQQPRPKVMKLGSSSGFSSFDPDFGNGKCKK
jgi:dihydroneopterin aldolase